MVTAKVCRRTKNFTFKIKLKNMRMFTLLIVFILTFSLSVVYFDVQGSLLNPAL